MFALSVRGRSFYIRLDQTKGCDKVWIKIQAWKLKQPDLNTQINWSWWNTNFSSEKFINCENNVPTFVKFCIYSFSTIKNQHFLAQKNRVHVCSVFKFIYLIHFFFHFIQDIEIVDWTRMGLTSCTGNSSKKWWLN